jgi:hypothetical protein
MQTELGFDEDGVVRARFFHKPKPKEVKGARKGQKVQKEANVAPGAGARNPAPEAEAGKETEVDSGKVEQSSQERAPEKPVRVPQPGA